MSVSSSTSRAVVTLILAPSLALAATVAPEHVHEGDADHPHSTVHRHLQPHAVASRDHDHATLADDDEHIVWLDSVALPEPGYRFAAPSVAPTERFVSVPVLASWVTAPDYDTAPSHGPPRACLSLRAPPCFSA